MTWHFDWPSFLIGALGTWACALVIVAVLFGDGKKPERVATPAEQLPAIPRWAAEQRGAALETEPDPFDAEVQRLIDGERSA